MVENPLKLFLYAQAFRFSSGKGRCFSPGFKMMCIWYWRRLSLRVFDRSAAKWWRGWLEKC